MKNKEKLNYNRNLLRSFLLAILFLACAPGLQAQQEKKPVILKLQNGSVLKGNLLRHSEGSYEMLIGSTARMSIPEEYVAQMLPDEPVVKKGYILLQTGLFFGQRVQGDIESILVAPSMQLSAGYMYRYWLQFGAGSGFERFGKILIFPVFAELRGNIFDKTFSPYYNLKLGGALADVKDDFRYQRAKGGIMAEAQAGMNIDFKDFSWLIGGGFRHQRVELSGTAPSWGWGGPENSRTQIRNLRRLILTTSFRFSF